MLQAICCATVSDTSERMCRRADKWKLQAHTTVETCLWYDLASRRESSNCHWLQHNSQRHAGVSAAAPERDVELMMMASDLLPFSSRLLRRNQCWRQLMQRESQSREPLSVISTYNCVSSAYSWCYDVMTLPWVHPFGCNLIGIY